GAVGKPNMRPPNPGSRSTPTVDGDSIYALGSDGDLVCLDKGGKVVWRKHRLKDFEGSSGTWAYAESPLIDGDTLVCTPGGPKATLVALNKKSGEVIWKASVPAPAAKGGGGGRGGMMRGRPNDAAYASGIVAEVGGVKQYVQFLGGMIVGVSARDGKLLWQYTGVNGIANCATPIFHDNCVFVSASGRGGAGGGALLRLTA